MSFNENKLEKSSIEKTPVSKKQNSDIACWASENLILRQKLFDLKNLTMPKTVKGGPLRFFNNHSVAKFQKKIEGEPIGVSENFSKKKQKNKNFQQSHSAEKSERDPLGFLTFVLLQNIKTN